jgi:hypothetical protein
VAGNGAVGVPVGAGSSGSASSGSALSGSSASSGAASSGSAPSGSAPSGAPTGSVAGVMLLEPPPATASFVPSSTALVILVSVAFTIAAGVSSFALDFAKAATSLF